jgi:hypothetical protein
MPLGGVENSSCVDLQLVSMATRGGDLGGANLKAYDSKGGRKRRLNKGKNAPKGNVASCPVLRSPAEVFDFQTLHHSKKEYSYKPAYQ